MAILGRGTGGRGLVARVQLCAILSTLTLAPMLTAEATMEYRVKAAFLYNFARFAEWPQSRNAAPLVIGVLGADPFGGALANTVHGKTIGGRQIVVRRVGSVEAASGCAILFVSSSERNRWPEILTPLRHTAVLTVGDAPGFLAAGGVMNFYLENNRVRFELNPAAARRSGLKLSAQLIRLAQVEGQRRAGERQ
ncbi:MAG: YfiR family protein [Acidobacteriales bacterium]|nr:YfiR family protein [Terriglobales bacterium]